MSRRTSSIPLALRRTLGVALVCAFAVLPASAIAAQPVEREHVNFTESFSDQLCGIGVDVELRVTDTFSVFSDWSVKGTGTSRGVITNPLNGKAVVLSTAGHFSDAAPVVDEAAGTITLHPMFKGLAEKIQTEHGGVLLRDAGIISHAVTLDLETWEFISAETIVNKGPHPEADSDFTHFCEVISGALA